MIDAVIIAMQVVILIAIAAYVIRHWRFRFDVQRMADVMAADLLERYQEDVQQLSEQGTKRYANETYIRYAATFGLPSAPADRVAVMVWEVIKDAQGVQFEYVEGPVIYE